MKTLFSLVIISIIFVSSIQGQPYFQRTYDFANTADYGFRITADSLGVFIINPIYCPGTLKACTGILHVDENGDEILKEILEDPFYGITINYLEQTRDGGILGVGDLQDSLYNQRILAVKFNSTFDTIFWMNTYDVELTEGAVWAKELSDGTFLIQNYAYVLNYSYKNVFKIDENGLFLWKIRIPSPYSNSSNGRIAWIGNNKLAFSNRSSLRLAPLNPDLITHAIDVLTLTDTLGNIIWQKTLPDTLEHFPHYESQTIVRQLKDKSLVISSVKDTVKFIPDLQRTNPIIYNYDTLGQQQWNYYFSGSDRKHIYGLSAAENGDLLGTGYAEFSVDRGPFIGTDYYQAGWIFRLSSTGELLWERYYYDSTWDRSLHYQFLYAITELSDGSIAATGEKREYIEGTSQIDLNILLLKLDSNGCLTPGCEDRDVIITAVEEPGQGEIVKEIFFKMAPNPVSDQVQIEFHNPVTRHNTNLRIVNSMGETVLQSPISKGTNSEEFALGHLPVGLYFVLYEQAGRILQTEKLIKQ